MKSPVAVRRAARRHHAVAAGALERRGQLGLDRIKAGRDHDVHVGGGCTAGEQQGGCAERGQPLRERFCLHEIPSVQTTSELP